MTRITEKIDKYLGSMINEKEEMIKDGYLVYKSNTDPLEDGIDYVSFYTKNDIKTYQIKIEGDGYRNEIVDIKETNKKINSGKKINFDKVSVFSKGKKYNKKSEVYIIVQSNNKKV